MDLHNIYTTHDVCWTATNHKCNLNYSPSPSLQIAQYISLGGARAENRGRRPRARLGSKPLPPPGVWGALSAPHSPAGFGTEPLFHYFHYLHYFQHSWWLSWTIMQPLGARPPLAYTADVYCWPSVSRDLWPVFGRSFHTFTFIVQCR